MENPTDPEPQAWLGLTLFGDAPANRIAFFFSSMKFQMICSKVFKQLLDTYFVDIDAREVF